MHVLRLRPHYYTHHDSNNFVTTIYSQIVKIERALYAMHIKDIERIHLEYNVCSSLSGVWY